MLAKIITIGDELLIGQVVDTNSAWMAQQLNLQGIRIDDIISISDTHAAITQAVDRALQTADLVLITGGLGPTKDDITKKALADYFGVGMEFHTPTYERILRLFERWGREPTEAHRDQCFMPANIQILPNKKGTAPGMWFEHNKKVLVSMPGVPREMKYLMEYEVLPRLDEHFPKLPIHHRTILTVGDGESRIAKRIESVEENLPEGLKLAFLPGLGQVRLRLTAIGHDEDRLKQMLDDQVKAIEALIPELIYGYGQQKLEEVVGQMLLDRQKSLCTAESCTGGYLSHKLTSIPGSSAYFKGGVIAYDNAVKQSQLAVAATTLESEGAVSQQTVIEMVKGALRLMETDVAVAISGIAGPGGGTPDKPVGTIWLAVGDAREVKTQKLQLGKDRLGNIQYTSVQALNMIRKFLLAQ
ncbi:MAG: competence/damage-inducible protein A [Bacteroidota bacterium]